MDTGPFYRFYAYYSIAFYRKENVLPIYYIDFFAPKKVSVSLTIPNMPKCNSKIYM